MYIIFTIIAKPPIMSAIIVTYSLYMIIGLSIYVMIRQKAVYWNKFLTWGFTIFALCFISILYAHNKNQVYNGLYTLFIPLLLTFSITQLITDKRDIKNILIVLASSGGILYLFMIKYGLLLIGSGERLGNEFYGNANGFASIISLSAMAAICSIYLSKNKLLWVVMFAVIIVDYRMLFLSEGRKYILTPINFLMLLLFKKSGFKLNKLILIGLLIIIISPIINTILSSADLLSDSLIRRFEMTGALLQGQEIAMGDGDIERKLMISKGLDFFASSPIWGNGHKNFGYLFAIETGESDYGHFSHNNYVELLCNLGLIGFFVYYFFYYKLLKSTYTHSTKESNIIFAFIIALMAIELGSISYYGNIFICILILFASLLVFKKEKIKF